jgi:hypothetical protein
MFALKQKTQPSSVKLLADFITSTASRNNYEFFELDSGNNHICFQVFDEVSKVGPSQAQVEQFRKMLIRWMPKRLRGKVTLEVVSHKVKPTPDYRESEPDFTQIQDRTYYIRAITD